MTTYLRLLDLGGFIATLILLVAAEEWITEEQMQTAYEPFVWACLKLPYFVILHEKWIDVLTGLRNLLRPMFVRRGF